MGKSEALGNLLEHLCHTQKLRQLFEKDIGGDNASERKIHWATPRQSLIAPLDITPFYHENAFLVRESPADCSAP
jgi:hypothetical protein